MADIVLKDVKKSYTTGVLVIHGVTATIADGEFIVIVGPSGCGKSTLLRMIAGLETITSGEIAIGGRVVNDVEPKDRNIAMVFQNYALYPHKTVFDNMAFGLQMRGYAKPDIDKRVREAADMLGIEVLLERKPRASSNSAPCSTASRGNCPAASASAWRWAAPSCGSRRCFCSTSRCRTSTPSCACKCARKSSACIRKSKQRPST